MHAASLVFRLAVASSFCAGGVLAIGPDRAVSEEPGGAFNAAPETRTYDLSPFAAHFPDEATPGRTVIDWIVRETGFDAWHGAIPAVLSANDHVLTVRHTPSMHGHVDETVRRFNADGGDAAFRLRVTTFAHPDWRARIHPLAAPLPVATPGAQAWLMSREGAAATLYDLQRRADFREQTSPQLTVPNGRPTTIAALRPRDYVQDVTVGATVGAPFTPRQGRIEEGFRIDVQPLFTLDRRLIDLDVKVRLLQVEKLATVVLDLSAAGAPERARLETPQIVERTIEERLRWPVDQVLVVAAGPGPTAAPNPDLRNRFGLPLPAAAARVEFVLWIEPLATPAPESTAGRSRLAPLAR